MNSEDLLFIDFETNKQGDFYLMGYQVNGKTHQVVLDTELQGFADHNGLPVVPPNEAILDIIQLVLRRGLRICAYGTLEKSILQNMASSVQLSGLEKAIYVNLHGAAKRWKNKFYRDDFESLPPIRKGADVFTSKVQRHSLISLCRLAGIEAPSDYAPGKTTSRFNALIKSLKVKNQAYGDLGPSTKAKGTKALKHNLFDVEALPILYAAIAKDDPELISRASSALID